MSKQETHRWLSAEDFDDAIKQLVDLLRGSDGTIEDKTQAFILSGWGHSHLGASVVFRAAAKLLKCDDSDMQKYFGKIFHVDCSQCKNRRTIQKAIARELNLHHVMHIFDKTDEEDDFRGVDDSSREEISSIGSLINRFLRNERFLMILQYGGVENMDLVECGIPAFGKGKLLCSSDGRFQVIREEMMLIPSFANIVVYMDFSVSASIHLRDVLHEEAVGVIDDIGMEGMNPTIVLDCFFYSLYVIIQLYDGVNIDWATHACNYWICDGILGEDKAWEICNALYRVMPPLGYISSRIRLLFLIVDIQDIEQWGRMEKKVCWWYPVTSNKIGAQDICNVPDCASSYFLTFQGDVPLYVPNDLFQQAKNLRVLKVCNCSFNFASPPFQCCHNLRFLWLEHCTNTEKEQSGVPFFPNLLVLDLRFTDYVLLAQMVELMTNLRELNTKGISWKTMSHGWKNLKKLHKLRVTESSDVVTVDCCSSVDMMSLELIDLSGNTHMKSLPTLSSARSLKMLILDGCSSLENVVLGRSHPLLENFSFDGYGQAENWTHSINLPQQEVRLTSPIVPVEIVKVTKISLDGCIQLHNIFLRALPNLEELDLSGTAIKILDVDAMQVPKLKKLFLLGCKHLHSLILGEEPRLEVLHVDMQGKKRSMVCCGGQGSFGFHAFVAFTDGRFIGSCSTGLYFRTTSCISKVYLLISCTSHSQTKITKSIKEIGSSQEGLVPTSPLLPYNNISLTEDVTCSSLVLNRRQYLTLDVHIEIGEGSYNLERMQDNAYFEDFVADVQSLHVHDNSSIIAIPPTAVQWTNLEWCHVDNCPNLYTMFSFPVLGENFGRMKVFSASDLPVAYCVWNRCIKGRFSHLQQLQHIYLYNCPRLVFVLPISFTLPNLETLQMAYCNSLRHVFPLNDKCPKEISSGVTFENLKHIKLYHLHNLEEICEAKLTAPVLQTISLRDCWALRRLPAVAPQVPKPVVDCEKDWWNKLEWDGLDVGHDPSLFETRHSAYYKKTLPRVSFLR
ncbi:uncharacterized protein LOC124698932 [Lolium rigidum]|uniref:uncharacterized protein LOC124698932 n=1 Tax=Lolium rigidum TaxID=89674 RepID=UPI001F5C89A9|nr:uncharacterized protein LOC124698932 [Lolium rigidum]